MLKSAEPIERELFGPPPGPVPVRVVVAVFLLAFVMIGITAQAAAFAESLKTEKWQGVAVVQNRQELLFTETVAVTLASPTVWQPVAQRFELDFEEFEKFYEAKAVDGTQAVSVSFIHTDPEVAQSVVRDVVDNYLAQFETPDDEPQFGVLETYLDALRLVEADLVELLANRDLLSRNEQIDRQNELVSVRQQITNVLLRMDEQGIDTLNRQDSVPRIVTQPFVENEPVEPEPVKMAVFGGAAGGMLAAFMAFIIFYKRAEPAELAERR